VPAVYNLRTTFISGGVGLFAMTHERRAGGQPGGKTYVLVHGAWHGGWCWQEAANHLAGMGHR
jgi:hypothetical protein